MIIPDINLLVYAYDSTSPWHARAEKWWTSCLSGTPTVGLPWVVALGFIRLWTNARIFENPMPVEVAVAHVETWLARSVVRLINPGPLHADLVFRYLRAESRGGNLTTDAHLAALSVEFRAVLHTADTDFARFPGIRTLNPLA